MSINGTNNNGYKVSTLGTDPSQEGWKAQETDPTADVDDLFDMGSDGTGSAGSDPMDDWTCGDTVNGSYADGGDGGTAQWLDSFPPILEDVLANSEHAINYLDMVMNRYGKAKEDLHALKVSHEQAIQSGTMTPEEIQTIVSQLPLIDEALSRCEAEMEKCSNMANDRSKVFIDEQRSLVDENADNWIGRPFAKGSYYVQYNDDGTNTYIDAITKKAVNLPFMDPDYQAELFTGNSLDVIDHSASVTKNMENGKELEPTDFFMKLNVGALNNNNTFGCPIDIGVPEYFWVERDPEGIGSDIYKMEFYDESSQDKMVLFNDWDTSSGLKQNVPSDLSRYAQVRVTEVVIKSEVCGTVDGEDIYRHVVEFWGKGTVDDGVLISRMSIEGTQVSGHMATAPISQLDDGSSGRYMAASSVGVALHPSNRASPISINGRAMKSTGRHLQKEKEAFIEKLGVSAPGDGGRGDIAFNENIGVFTDENFSVELWEDGEWQTKSTGHNEGTYGFDGLNDRYVSEETDAEPGEGPYMTYKTGLHIEGFRGDIVGTKFNDVVICPGANKHDAETLEHMPDDFTEIRKGDAYYNNFVNTLGGGNDLVVAKGHGDNYIEGATFVAILDSSSQDGHFIKLPEMTPGGTGIDVNASTSPNQKHYVYLDSGHSEVYNPHEVNNSYGAETPDEAKEDNPGFLDDWYEVVGSASAAFGDPFDLDVLNSAHQTDSQDPIGADFLGKAKADPYELWYNELTAVPDPDDVNTDIDLDEIMGSKNDLDNEMNGFFDEMFGDLNSFMGEYEEEQIAGF